jgi:hypothetical protein
MEVMKMTRLTIVCISFIVVSLMFVGISSAKIDPKTVVGAWTLDEGSGKIAKDSSMYENDGTLISDPDWVDGHFGKALSFDGKTDYIDCGNAESLNLTKSLTVMGWVNPDKALGLDNWQRFAARGEYNTGWMIGITNTGKPDLTVTNAAGGFVTMYGKTTTDLGKWYHIAGVVASDAQKVYIYLNGTLDNDPKAHSGEMMNPNVSTVIGKSGVAHVYDFHGIIDEVVIVNVALEPEDIQTIMNKGLGSMLAVSQSGKLTTTWADLKQQ